MFLTAKFSNQELKPKYLGIRYRMQARVKGRSEKKMLIGFWSQIATLDGRRGRSCCFFQQIPDFGEQLLIFRQRRRSDSLLLFLLHDPAQEFINEQEQHQRDDEKVDNRS